MLNEQYNTARPMVMHIDLNSCFATVEQQARPMLRGRPVAIVNRRTEHTTIVTASYEAKARGVTLGMSVKEAKRLCPNLVALESDPTKYRYVYHKLMGIMSDYSPHFRMKSIDEGVIDFAESTELIAGRDLVDVAYEIKQRLRDEIGCWMRCNIGIAPNRFLAKTAAGLNKPDGLNVIDAGNLRDTLGKLDLEDLTGIAGRNRRRLEQVGIYTPLEFLDASEQVLRGMVFKSICGTQWHQRLRGWEVDKVDYDLKTCGRQYVLESRDLSRTEVLQRLHHLCEAVGRKLRGQGKCARGVGVYVRMVDSSPVSTNGRWGKPSPRSLQAPPDHLLSRSNRFSLVDGGLPPSPHEKSLATPTLKSSGYGWSKRGKGKGNYFHEKHLTPLPFFSDAAIYAIASRLFSHAPDGQMREIGIHCYHLSDNMGDQLSLFGDEIAREQQVTWAIDEINARYGERTIHTANTLGTDTFVKQKIPFGSTRYL